jgi:hypothetical protein
MPMPEHREAVVEAEAYADNKIGCVELKNAYRKIAPQWFTTMQSVGQEIAESRSETVAQVLSSEQAFFPIANSFDSIRFAIGTSQSATTTLAWSAMPGNDLFLTEEARHLFDLAWEKCKCQQSSFVHDIFGNPFRPITLDTSWSRPNVVALAQAIYDDRTFDRLPVFADALEEAGCDNREIWLFRF